PLQALPAGGRIAAEVAEVLDAFKIDMPDHASPYPDSAIKSRLAEGGLVEAAQLARMQARAFLPQQVHRRHGDPQMLADGALIEGVGLSRQLDLPVQGLV